MGTDNIFKRGKEDRKKREENVREARNKTWLVLCEGSKTEPYYFKGLEAYLNTNGSKQITIKAEGDGRNTESLVSSVEDYFNFVDKCYGSMHIKYQNIIFVFDKDSFENKQFNNAIKKARNYEHKGINKVIVAWSNESFELWLCLHYQLIESSLERNQYNKRLTDIFRQHSILTENQNYDKNGKNLKNIFTDILASGGDLKTALRNAKKLSEQFDDGKNPAQSNPCTMVYKAIEALAHDARYKF